MAVKENPLSAPLSQGAARRSASGEQASPMAVVEPEKLLAVAIPRSLHKELKAHCARADISIKEFVTRGISREMDAIRGRTTT